MNHNTLIYRIIAVALFSLFFLSSFGTCEKEIKDFYVRYMQNIENNPDLNVSLMETHMSPELISKLAEYTVQTDADAIIRAQDVCGYCISSLTIEHLENEWYMVRYRWDADSEYIEIPLKACSCDSSLKIVYITPSWLGSQYGDNLLNK